MDFNGQGAGKNAVGLLCGVCAHEPDFRQLGFEESPEPLGVVARPHGAHVDPVKGR